MTKIKIYMQVAAIGLFTPIVFLISICFVGAITGIVKGQSSINGDCPELTPIQQINFVGTIFYNSYASTSDHTLNYWRLDAQHQQSKTAMAMSGGWTSPNHSSFAFRYGDKLVWLDSEGKEDSIQWQPMWSWFSGWTNDDRLIVRTIKDDFTRNGFAIVDQNGQEDIYTDFSYALDPKLWNIPSIPSFYVSPTGYQVVYEVGFPNGSGPLARGLVLSDVKTGQEIWRTTANQINDLPPPPDGWWSGAVWSPTGKQFAYVRNNGNYDNEIALVDQTGYEQEITSLNEGVQFSKDSSGNVTASGTFNVFYDLQWSPDGKQIAFWQQDFMHWLPGISVPSELTVNKLTILDVNSAKVRFLCISKNPVTTFSWSPDSQALVFSYGDHLRLIDPNHNTFADLPTTGSVPLVLTWLDSH